MCNDIDGIDAPFLEVKLVIDLTKSPPDFVQANETFSSILGWPPICWPPTVTLFISNEAWSGLHLASIQSMLTHLAQPILGSRYVSWCITILPNVKLGSLKAAAHYHLMGGPSWRVQSSCSILSMWSIELHCQILCKELMKICGLQCWGTLSVSACHKVFFQFILYQSLNFWCTNIHTCLTA